MNAFRVLLITIFTAIFVYTAFVISEHGMGLFQIFFRDIAAMGWPGQFNLDFLGFLILSGLWLAWRHHFAPIGLALGALGFFGGAPVLTAYLLYASFDAKGDIREMLLGRERAAA
ncbi:MAG: hypothetical protein R3E82_19730 [Pseudomonadales bacterium]|nr:hypothetical protein [Pseudomonadales bacterium]